MSETQAEPTGYVLTDQDRRRAAVWQSLYGVGGVLHSKTPAPLWPTEPSAEGIKNHGPLPSRAATSPQRIRFLREKVRSYAYFMACLDLAGVADEWLADHGRAGITAEVETLMAATGIACETALPFIDGCAAGKAEFSAATARARQFVDDLRRAVFPLARAQSSGGVMLAAAHEVNDRYGCALPTPLLVNACQVIAISAAPRQFRRR
jgi:hypothetical protein